jgi:2-amino-4-hydroxy-6-hydroxymethyldihydropteridine diphosphokinase
MHQVFLSLGSNMGNRKSNLGKAVKKLGTDNGQIAKESSIYETEAWGNKPQRNYYNQAIELLTNLDPPALLIQIHRIEVSLGRVFTIERFVPRPVDIDILFYENLIYTSESLMIPHPLIHSRRFVLVPMVEIAPEFLHPVLGKTIEQLLMLCDDELKVEKIR